MKSLTTDQRLRHAIAALRQAATLVREASRLGGGLVEATRLRLQLEALAIDVEVRHLERRRADCNRDLQNARERRRRAA